MADLLAEFAKLLVLLYRGLFTELLNDLYSFFIYILVIKLVLEGVFLLFPFIHRVMQLIFFPFNALHQWTHIHKAKQINQKAITKRVKKVNKAKLTPTERFLASKLIVKPTFSMGIGDRENTGIIILPNEELTLRELMGLVTAPSKYGLIITGFLIIVSPFVLFEMPRYGEIFALIHLYFLLGAFLFLFPSQEDYRLVWNSIVTSTTVSPAYLLYGVALFILATVYQLGFYDPLDYPDYWYFEIMYKTIFVTGLYYIGVVVIIALVGPDITLKTQKESTLIAEEGAIWKEQQKETIIREIEDEGGKALQQQKILEILLAEEETIDG